MAIRLPRAITSFQKLTETDLITSAQAVKDGLVASVATFPTPVVSAVLLQGFIDDYTTKLGLAVDGSKQSTAAKNHAKFLLKNALRSDAAYVNQIIFNLIATGTSYGDAQDKILQSGYELSKDPAPIGGLAAPVVKKFSSPSIGQLYVLTNRIYGAKSYEMIIRPVTTPEAAWSTYAFPTSRITLTGLQSATQYEFRIAGIGADVVRVFNSITRQVII